MWTPTLPLWPQFMQFVRPAGPTAGRWPRPALLALWGGVEVIRNGDTDEALREGIRKIDSQPHRDYIAGGGQECRLQRVSRQ